MPKTAPYQILAPLRPEEVHALREDISHRGVLVPVEVDDDGNVLDGHHRVMIAEELGIRYRKVVRRFESDDEKIEHALKLNLLRRHLGPVAWAEAFRKLCRVRGVRLGSGAQKKNGNGKARREETATVAALAEELGVAPRTARWRLRLAQDLKGHKDLSRAVDAGEKDAKAAKREARTRNARKEAKKNPPRKVPNSVRIEHGDFRNLKIRPGTVDLIVTDPPYTKEFLPVWSDLGELAARVLKPGHLLVTYCGQWAFPEVLNRLTEHLKFVWIGSVVLQGYRHPQFHGIKVKVKSKPLLFLSNGDYQARKWFDDSVVDGGFEKESHPWQQAEAEAEYYVDRFTEPGELVVDPFLGSGTTAVAAKGLGRRFRGCDVDADAVAVARGRVAESTTLRHT